MVCCTKFSEERNSDTVTRIHHPSGTVRFGYLLVEDEKWNALTTD